MQLQASPVPCTLPPLGLAPRALARRETLHVTLLDHSIDGLDALGVVWSPRYARRKGAHASAGLVRDFAPHCEQPVRGLNSVLPPSPYRGGAMFPSAYLNVDDQDIFVLDAALAIVYLNLAVILVHQVRQQLEVVVGSYFSASM